MDKVLLGLAGVAVAGAVAAVLRRRLDDDLDEDDDDFDRFT